MERISKLRTVFKALEAEVQIAEKDRVKIEGIFEARKKVFDELNSRRAEKNEQLNDLEKNKIPQAIRLGSASLKSYSSWITRLNTELKSIDLQIDAKEPDYQTASKRLEEAEEVLLELRRERLKVEKLIEDLKQKTRILDEAREEVDLEGLYSRKK